MRLATDEQTVQRLTRRLRKDADSQKRKLDRIREAIEAGLYENPLKISVAMDRLLEKIDR